MFSLTSYERKVLIGIAILICCGAILRFLQVHLSGKHIVSATTKIPVTQLSNTTILTKPSKVNVNNASVQALETLPGVGPYIARRIVTYRNRNGYFRSPEDLEKIKGIGKKKLEMMREYIMY